jgi:hypothetical protein
MTTLRTFVKDLEALHASALNELKSKADSKAHSARVDAKTEETSALTQKIGNDLKQMKADNDAYERIRPPFSTWQ